MDISEEQIGDTCVVTAKGRLDGGASAAFAERIGGLITTPNPKLLIDFAGVDFVTSAGLRAVLLLVKKVKAAGGTFALCAVQDSVREVLDITGFTGMFSIHPARADAIAALA
ncbi:MAG TPA: STAS domain-containing protein [Xanthobacteraceae bacterium]|nr:STAS domain-containing protein [Xanthobacteraceae bacterium]